VQAFCKELLIYDWVYRPTSIGRQNKKEKTRKESVIMASVTYNNAANRPLGLT